MITKNPFEELENKINERFDEIKSLILAANPATVKPDEPEYLYSLQELADFIGCSIVTAQKLKNNKSIPYYQVGRKVVFEKKAVLDALQPTIRLRKKGAAHDDK